MSSYALRLDESEVARYRSMADRARTSEAGLWARANITRGARVADIGCGPGAVLALLAEIVGPSGSAVGVDADVQAVSAARSQLAATGATTAQARVGQADETGLEPGSFDAVMLRHVLAHNGGNEQRIVEHLASLVRPGGAVYLLDVDLTAFRMVPLPVDLEDMLDRYASFHRMRGNDPQVGLRLDRLAKSAGLTVEVYRGWFEIIEAKGMRGPAWAAREALLSSGVISSADLQRWETAWEGLQGQPQFFAAVFAAVCRRPVGLRAGARLTR